MAFELAEAYVELNQRGFGGVMGAIRGIGAGLVSMGPMAIAAGGALAAVGAGAGIAGLIGAAAEAESTAAQFETLLQSADRAKEHIDELKAFGASTPFEFPGLANTSKLLLAFGVQQEQIVPTMRVLGDIASATGKPMDELAQIYGKIRGQGKLTGETLEQLAERGIPIVGELAKAFGKSEAEIRKMVTEGKIGLGDVQKAFNSLTGEGGRFAGGMAKQSQTLSGLWSTFSDEMGQMMTEIGVAIAEGLNLKEGTSLLTQFTSFFRGAVVPNIVSAARWMRENVIDVAFSVVNNWEQYWALFQATNRLIMDNVVNVVRAAMTNAGNFVSWFVQSGVGLVKWFKDAGVQLFNEHVSNVWTYYSNLFSNIRNGFLEVYEFIRTRGADPIEFAWKDLGEGIRTEVVGGMMAEVQKAFAKMPELAIPEMRLINNEIVGILAEIDKRNRERRAESAAEADSREIDVEGGGTGRSKGSGLRVEFIALTALADKMQQAINDQAKDKAAIDQAQATKELRDAAKNEGLRVQIVGARPSENAVMGPIDPTFRGVV